MSETNIPGAPAPQKKPVATQLEVLGAKVAALRTQVNTLKEALSPVLAPEAPKAPVAPGPAPTIPPQRAFEPRSPLAAEVAALTLTVLETAETISDIRQRLEV